MGKPNAFLAKMEARFAKRAKIQRLFCIQMCRDIATIAVNRVFGAGSERAYRFLKEFDAIFFEYAIEVIEDVKNDKQFEYSKEQIDRALQKILGKRFVPWEERYFF